MTRLVALAVVIYSAALVAVTAQSASTVKAAVEGGQVFRFDTFGDERLWTGVLRMHGAIASVPSATAFAVGLTVDLDALPRPIVDGLTRGEVYDLGGVGFKTLTGDGPL